MTHLIELNLAWILLQPISSESSTLWSPSLPIDPPEKYANVMSTKLDRLLTICKVFDSGLYTSHEIFDPPLRQLRNLRKTPNHNK